MAVGSNGHQLTLVCPNCDNQQREPSMVVSTYCRVCSHHISVEDGKAKARPSYQTRLTKPNQAPVQHPAVAEKEEVVSKTNRREPSRLRRLFVREPAKRTINCYHCEHQFQVISDAQSTQCSKCGGYVSLLDYEIDQAWQRRIQTRGNVTILKGGSITGVDVTSHDLVVLGELFASVNCSGRLVIRNSGKILGAVKCGELRVERGAKVEFQGEVTAAEVFINGEVRAQIVCSGTIVLEKRSRLQGPIRAAKLIVKAGAKHLGAMEMVSTNA